MTKFSNHFLIAMPHMYDSFFKQSLVFMCEHDDKGAMGLIVNKPMMTDNVEQILTETHLDRISPYPNVYFGGPVRIEQGFFLHEKHYSIDGTFNVSDKISITSNPQIIEDIVAGKGPDDFRFTLGYAGWGEGQLEREVENGDWLVMPASAETIFRTPDHKKWKTAASQFGIDILDFDGQAGHA